MMRRRPEVAGGGIAGPTVGPAFARNGWSVRLHEQDTIIPDLRPHDERPIIVPPVFRHQKEDAHA